MLDPSEASEVLNSRSSASAKAGPHAHSTPFGEAWHSQIQSAASHGNGQSAYSFAGFRLDADGTLLRGEAVVHLPPKELAALRFLISHTGEIVTPVQLRKAIWGNVHVTADSVPKIVSSLRARLEPEDCIQTIYKQGYRLGAEVQTQSAPRAAELPRLAIPPFATEFGIPEYLGSAIAEEAITRLSNAIDPAVTVLARDSVFTLARQRLTAQQIGEALNADLALTGTIRAVPAHFRLRAEMIRVRDGAQIWAEDLLVDRNRVAGLEWELIERLDFRLQSSAAVSRGSLNSSPLALPSKDRSTAESVAEFERNASARSAYESYQQGRHEWHSLQRHRMQDGLQHLNHATEIDPGLIAAKVDLAHLCITQSFCGFMAPILAAEIVRRTGDSIAARNSWRRKLARGHSFQCIGSNSAGSRMDTLSCRPRFGFGASRFQSLCAFASRFLDHTRAFDARSEPSTF